MQRYKRISVQGYNRVFDTSTGFTARWGNSKDENPVMCPLGPEIADIEISTICHGIGKTMETRVPCSWCYKSNTGTGENMSFETFSGVLSKMKNLDQVALGIGDIDGNPDLWRIMQLSRDHGVIPNVTVNGMGIDQETAQRLAKLCGAVAVSHYGDDLCFNAVNALSEAGLKQVNIHKLLSKETLASCFRLIDQVKTDSRLKGLKAIVFLMLKPKGDRNKLHGIDSLEEYRALLDYACKKGVGVGMDSCSAPMALKSLPAAFADSVEPCESGLFSIYVNVKGEIFPCSFTEGTPGWETGINVLAVSDFRAEVWYSPRLVAWRSNLIKSADGCVCDKKADCRVCPVYNITVCKSDLVRISPVDEIGVDCNVQVAGTVV
jgi:MoaA/NifB/PqqE/SkfB family radical SAM enzyme